MPLLLPDDERAPKFKDLLRDDQIARVTKLATELAEQYFPAFDSIELVNYEFNATFKIIDGTEIFAFRLNINSTRNLQNLQAELEFVGFLGKYSPVKVPRPIATLANSFISSGSLPGMARPIHAVMSSWLEGAEIGDDPTSDQLEALGVSMARMHEAVIGFEFMQDSSLPVLDDFFWGSEDFLFSVDSKLESDQRVALATARKFIEQIVSDLFARESKILIHGDLHGWNLMWNNGELAIFDFDDCGIGAPILDLAIAHYYLDTTEQSEALLAGYRSVRPLPEYSNLEMQALLLQRRILLLNYLYETSNQEHQKMLPEYLKETLHRTKVFLDGIM